MLPILAIVLVLVLNAIACKILVSRHVDRILGVSIFLAQLMWWTVPAVMGIVFPSLLNGVFWIARISETAFHTACILEVATVSIALCLFYQLAVWIGRTSKMSASNAVSSGATDWVVVSLCLLFVAYYAATTSFDYLERNAMAIMHGQEQGFLLNQILSFLRTLLVTCVFVIYVRAERARRSLCLFALGVLCFYAVVIVMAGARIFLFLPVLAVLIKSLTRSRIMVGVLLKRLAVFGIIVLLTLPVLYSIQKSRQLRRGSHDFVAAASGVNAEIALNVLMTKLDSFSKGVLLVRNSGAGRAGFRPYVGSALVFVPRLIMPSRPVAGSMDGSYSGIPCRVVPKTEGWISSTLNVGVSPVYVAIWHFGYVFGITVFVMVVVAYLILLNRLLSSGDKALDVIVVYMISIPSLAGVLISPDQVVRNSVMIFWLVVCVHVVRAALVAAKRAASPSTDWAFQPRLNWVANVAQRVSESRSMNPGPGTAGSSMS